MIPSILALAAKPSVAENISFIAIGFLFVLAVLAALSILTSVIGVACSRLIKDPSKEKKATLSKAAAQPVAIATESDIPEHIVALIATATHIALKGRPQRIVSIRGSQSGWAQEGRREIFSSHRVR